MGWGDREGARHTYAWAGLYLKSPIRGKCCQTEYDVWSCCPEQSICPKQGPVIISVLQSVWLYDHCLYNPQQSENRDVFAGI